MTERHHVTSIETYSGHYLDYFNPRADQIEIADIARGLAHTCRYAGQTTVYYSVAEHAVRVRDWVVARQDAMLWPASIDPDVSMAALHHDSHEAYLGDWPSPLKHVFDSELLATLAADLDLAIAGRFEFAPRYFDNYLVKEADLALLRAEAATLKYSHGIGPHWANEERHTPLAGLGWSPERAERKFLEAHNHEMRQLHG